MKKGQAQRKEVKRYCHECSETTKWYIYFRGDGWETHLCTNCNYSRTVRTE